jgi:two-component system response regulator AtoC
VESPDAKLVLIVDDDAAMGEVVVRGLCSSALRVEAVSSPAAALARMAAGDVEVVVTDLRMPAMTGLELCRQIVERSGDIPVIVLTAFGDYETAVEAVRAGAFDFIAKPVRFDVLRLAVERALAHASLRREVHGLRTARETVAPPRSLIGRSPAIQDVLELIGRVAASESSVLVTGESGTGKELVARALHEQGARSSGPFVAINCAALPEALLESELFGHERGAFTDARSARAGLFLEANGGTLFLDEISELPTALQPKLLRALQERCVRPLGARREVPFDVRLVAATHRDLELWVKEGRFREDLYFRINVIEIALPPLRARGSDVLLLAQHFLTGFAERSRKPIVGITPEAAARLLAHDWPGNVRELANAIERGVALASNDHLTPADLPERIRQAHASGSAGTDLAEFVTLEEMERRYILKVVDFVGGSRSIAAQILGLDRTTLWRRLERYGALKSQRPR